MFEAPHVGIVGAGISGLRCAEVLLNHGFKVTILEARDRIGGRICQSDEIGYQADIGPNWIHQSKAEGRYPIVDLAHKTKTPLHNWNSFQNIYTSSGTLLSSSKSDELSTLLWQLIEDAFVYSNENEQSIPASESLFDFIKRKVEERDVDKEDKELIFQMAEMWGAYVGDPVTKQSLRFAWMEGCCGGEGETFVTTTFASIISEIAAVPLAKGTLHLNTKVTAVSTKSKEVEGSRVILTTEKGETFKFDEVVMTTPLGWLKRNKDIFTPTLPHRLLSAIDNISVGCLEKVYITFPSAFWLSSNTEDTFPGYTNWLSPSYSTSTNPSKWSIEAWNLASFAPPNNHPTLIFYLYGPLSAYLTSLLPHNPLSPSSSQPQETLSQFFLPYISLLPNYNSQNDNCQVKKILCTNWQNDELAGNGSYCNFQTGIEDAATDVKTLKEGVKERGLWIAGEAAAPYEELGTVAGAYLSGEGVGERICGIYGRQEVV